MSDTVEFSIPTSNGKSVFLKNGWSTTVNSWPSYLPEAISSSRANYINFKKNNTLYNIRSIKQEINRPYINSYVH